ncbi:MAG: nucleotide pyrophosphatase/phosphodiesterase family protein [Opitutales bacterium]
MNKNDCLVLFGLGAILFLGLGLGYVQKRVPPTLISGPYRDLGPAGTFTRESGATKDDSVRGDVVVWISVDGVRSDYLDCAETPFFDFLLENGAFSLEHDPVFPSVTFPSHVSQATGTTVAEHGITGNRFFEAAPAGSGDGEGRIHSYPADSGLLQAEPIWNTAQRQGLRVAVHDWPVSHAQKGENQTVYFTDRFNGALSDKERLDKLFTTWRSDTESASAPLSLVMGYIKGTDAAGHTFGPNSPEVDSAMAETDRLLGDFYHQVTALWRETMHEGESLYFIFSSEHGMSEVHTLVHVENLTGLEGQSGVHVITVANVANIHFDGPEPAAERKERIAHTLSRASEFDFIQAYRREDLPEAWGYNHSSRTGDVVLVMDEGYTFSRRANGITSPVNPAVGPLGMHGYDPATTPDMRTIALFHRYPQALNSGDLGPTHSLQLHPTVADLLKISPADGAKAHPIELQNQRIETY